MALKIDVMGRRKVEVDSGFGERLIALRRLRGLTQVQLAEAIESTQRAISHYETFGGYPPAPVLVTLAKALGVTTDELLGIRRPKLDARTEDPETRRLWKKFQQVSELPEKDQRAVIRLINSLAGGRE
jgi:transcriptional regulator with XRE-family HTH domain